MLEAFPSYNISVTASGSWSASGFGNPRAHTFAIDEIEYSLSGASYGGQSNTNVYSVCCDPDVTGSASFSAERSLDAPPAINGEVTIRIVGEMSFGDAGAATIEIDLIFDPVGAGAFPCPASSYSVTLPAQFPGANGGQFTVGVNAPVNCPWAAVKQHPIGNSGSDFVNLSIVGSTNSYDYITGSGSQSVVVDIPSNIHAGLYLSTVIDIAGQRLAYTQPPATPVSGAGPYVLNRVEVKRTYGGPITGIIGPLTQIFPATALVLAYQAGWDFLWGTPAMNHSRFVSVMNLFSVPATVTPGAYPPYRGNLNVDMHADWLASGYGISRYHTLSTSGSGGTFDQEFAENHCQYRTATNDPNGNSELQCDTNANVGGSQLQPWPYPDSNGEIRLVQFGTTDFEDAGTVTVEVDAVYTVGEIGGVAALGFFPLPACRAVDTRPSQNFAAPFGAPSLNGYAMRAFPLVQSTCKIPATAQAYSLNFTAVPSGRLDFLSAWSTGQPYPRVSTLNSPLGNTIANAAIVVAGTAGNIEVVTGQITDLLIDVDGFFAPPNGSDLAFYTLPPCRVADTRVSQGFPAPFGPPSLAGYSQRDFPIRSSSCNIPASALAYSLNITAVPLGRLDFLSIWPVGQAYPKVSTLNAPDGSTIANAAIVQAGSNGDVNVVTGNPTDIIIDVNGYFAPPGLPAALHFYAVPPCRVMDSRPSQGFPPPFGAPGLSPYVTRNIPIQSSACGIPATAKAYSLNFTVVPSGPLDFLSAWPVGQSYPKVSTLNAPDGVTLANAAIVPAGTNGDIQVVAGKATDLLIDINGYFAP